MSATKRQEESAAKDLDSGALAARLAELADSKGATEIVVLDMRELVSYTDFLAICTARNERQARAIVDEVKLQAEERGRPAAGGHRAGRTARTGSWSTSSTPCCTCSPRTPGERYQLEDLWREAPRVESAVSAA